MPSRLRRSNVTVAAEPVSIVRCVFCLDRHQNVIKTSGQSLADSSPNTEYQQDPTRATGTRTRESEHLQYALQKPFRTSEVKPHRVRRFAARAWLLVS